MKISSTLFVISILLSSYVLIRNTTKQKIQIIEINSRFEVFTPSLKLEAIENTIKIAFNGPQRLYIIPRIKVEEQNILNEKGEIIGTKGVYVDTNYVAFAWNIGDTIGLKYSDVEKLENSSVVKVDSIIANLSIGDADFQAFCLDLPTPSSVIEKKGKRIEKYSVPKKSVAEVDSIYRYYDKSLVNIDFSFSKKFDKLNKSKLYKTTYIWNKLPKGAFMPDVEVPRREGYYEMVISSDNDLEKIEPLFKKSEYDRKLKLGLN